MKGDVSINTSLPIKLEAKQSRALPFTETLNLCVLPERCALQFPFGTSDNQAAMGFMRTAFIKTEPLSVWDTANVSLSHWDTAKLRSEKGSELNRFLPLPGKQEGRRDKTRCRSRANGGGSQPGLPAAALGGRAVRGEGPLRGFAAAGVAGGR